MALVKAKMSFYHDEVGTRALDEMFEVQNEQLVSKLEQAGYVQRVEGQALQAFEQTKVLEQEVGKRNALTNEAVSMASHEHNQKTLKDQENFAQVRQQTSHYAVEQEINRLQQAGDNLKAQQLQQTLDQAKQQQQEQNRTQMNQQANQQTKKFSEAMSSMSQVQMEGNTEIAQAEQAGANEASSKPATANAKKANK
jgi:hypothetical protein